MLAIHVVHRRLAELAMIENKKITAHNSGYSRNTKSNFTLRVPYGPAGNKGEVKNGKNRNHYDSGNTH